MTNVEREIISDMREIISDMMDTPEAMSDTKYVNSVKARALLDIGEQLSRLNDTLERLIGQAASSEGPIPALTIKRL